MPPAGIRPPGAAAAGRGWWKVRAEVRRWHGHGGRRRRRRGRATPLPRAGRRRQVGRASPGSGPRRPLRSPVRSGLRRGVRPARRTDDRGCASTGRRSRHSCQAGACRRQESAGRPARADRPSAFQACSPHAPIGHPAIPPSGLPPPRLPPPGWQSSMVPGVRLIRFRAPPQPGPGRRRRRGDLRGGDGTLRSI
ncbi:hypothetical protein AL072_21790 [Azospirillum thiophilum]|uniref:Uncharacterized protein n=1 Tax=Azospirillum thiophilum TaxID=528244 RepID=A0AAC8W2A3_9PROT|nr:hypothetical protein AL072_21790 [Azospirillum thiophilum]